MKAKFSFKIDFEADEAPTAEKLLDEFKTRLGGLGAEGLSKRIKRKHNADPEVEDNQGNIGKKYKKKHKVCAASGTVALGVPVQAGCRGFTGRPSTMSSSDVQQALVAEKIVLRWKDDLP